MNNEAVVDFATLETWFHCKPVNEHGLPTSELSLALLRFFQSHPDEIFDVSELSEEFYVPPVLVQILCRQLEHLFLLVQDPPDNEQFRVYHGPRNAQFRHRVWQQLATVAFACRSLNPTVSSELPDHPESNPSQLPESYPRVGFREVGHSADPY